MGRMKMAVLPATRGRWPGTSPGADPHIGAMSWTDTPWMTSPELRGGGLWGATEHQWVTVFQCPQRPPLSRPLYPTLLGHESYWAQGSTWSCLGMEPVSTSAHWCCHSCTCSSPFRQPNKCPVAFYRVFFKTKEQPIAANTFPTLSQQHRKSNHTNLSLSVTPLYNSSPNFFNSKPYGWFPKTTPGEGGFSVEPLALAWFLPVKTKLQAPSILYFSSNPWAGCYSSKEQLLHRPNVRRHWVWEAALMSLCFAPGRTSLLRSQHESKWLWKVSLKSLCMRVVQWRKSVVMMTFNPLRQN